MREPSVVAAHSERLIQLRKDYEDRKAFWVGSTLEAGLKATLVSKSDSEVQRFWTLLFDRVLPALNNRDLAGAERAYAELQEAYTTHRGMRLARLGSMWLV